MSGVVNRSSSTLQRGYKPLKCSSAPHFNYHFQFDLLTVAAGRGGAKKPDTNSTKCFFFHISCPVSFLMASFAMSIQPLSTLYPVFCFDLLAPKGESPISITGIGDKRLQFWGEGTNPSNVDQAHIFDDKGISMLIWYSNTYK